jgi:osmotically-inducible protein OsmY
VDGTEVKKNIDRLRVPPSEPMSDGAIAAHIERSLLEDSAFGGFSIATRLGPRAAAAPQETGSGGDSDGRAAGAPWIDIGVDGGVVTLDGDVPSLSHKRLAGVLAWWAPGSRDVVNGLGVEPDEQDTDEEILDALRIVLDKDLAADASQISATCKNAVITLEGLVGDEAERDLVELDAWALFGVDKVVNRIVVA